MKKECTNCHITLGKDEIELKYKNKCPMCGKLNSFVDEYIMDIKRISSDESFISNMIMLHDTNIIEFEQKLNQFKLQQNQTEAIKEQQREEDIPHCPHCNSTNIRTLSVLNRGVSIAIWGIFSKKINKSFECLDCKYTW